MPFEIFILPGLIFFAYAFFKAKSYYEKEYDEKGDND
jgi:hypothetical protein